MFILSELSDVTLAECVDEYVKRVMRSVHEVEEVASREYVTLKISASCHDLTEGYEIKHEITCGWGQSVVISGNNAIRDGVKAMKRYLDDKRTSQPTKVQPMLVAPTPFLDEGEVAEFTDVSGDPLPIDPAWGSDENDPW